MARKHVHEEHVNAEAWAIPYGDLVTLLLAFFVVMYAVSSVNEGKYRVLADAMAEAFGGPPKSISPLQMGREQQRGSQRDSAVPVGVRSSPSPVSAQPVRDFPTAIQVAGRIVNAAPQPSQNASGSSGYESTQREKLGRLAERLEESLAELIDQDLVVVRRVSLSLEIEIKTDILYGSGSAALTAPALDTLARVAAILRDGGNALRIEGHTDNRPIHTYLFPSNWELSAARAASVVHLFNESGVAASRLSLMGWAEQRPRADNESDAGRSANRRVVIVVLAEGGDDDPALQGRLARREPADRDPLPAPTRAAPMPADAPPQTARGRVPVAAATRAPPATRVLADAGRVPPSLPATSVAYSASVPRR